MASRRRAKRIGDPRPKIKYNEIKVESKGVQKTTSKTREQLLANNRKRKVQVYEREFDYMKYWKIIRKWAQAQYDLTYNEIDLLFFIYSELYFSRQFFNEYAFIFGQNTRKLDELVARGWIDLWREKRPNQRALYVISRKGVFCIKSIYDKLEGLPFATSERRNRVYANRRSAPMRRCAAYMRKLNHERLKLLRLARESQDNKYPEE